MSVNLTDLLARLEALPPRADTAFAAADSDALLNQTKAEFLGRNGALREVQQSMREVEPSDRPLLGKALNSAREAVEAALESRRVAIRAEALNRNLAETHQDLTLPSRRAEQPGAIHPLKRIEREVVDIFRQMGYDVADGPAIETDFHNFEALNFPPDHPARDMQDTLLLKNGHLLRTHTSPVQVRTMLTNEPPIRVIVPGTVFRCDDDITHSPMFTQVEGLLIDEDVTLADLKGTLQVFASRLFGRQVPVRLRPSFFPFTEPSVEVDVGCVFCPAGGGCRVCHDSSWIEILGAGMVDPNVLEAVGIDSERYTGFAFGVGVERITMLKYGVNDIRLFFENDIRFLRQF